ncbi:aminotransferase class V-fold PLP-dependent enzyme [Geminicoccaceae bacterium 1502E]|nr:aminotransferase class V-fold PLP-dependent enzyme [Geminicoccaceae bacterium 1502E]
MNGIYERLGVVPMVNAKGPATRLSGGPMRSEVAAAMAEAAGSCVDMLELHAAAGAIVARHTGAEAGLVTAGASAAILLGTAACIAGMDPAAMARLPDTRGLRNRVVMVRSQRNQYDHAVRAAGVEIVEAGLPDRVSGAGCRDAEPWEIEAAIDERTAAVHYVADAKARPSLEAVVAVAHARGVPVLVDAAAQLPPASNLRRFTEAGADLVCFSGGKAIGGPQASGILAGRRELVASAALQMLDMDYPDGFFRPPPGFIDKDGLKGLPPHGIGRSCKVAKEQIAGLVTALELFVAEGDEVRSGRWRAILEEIAGGLPAGLAELRDGPVPQLVVQAGGRAPAIYRALIEGNPVIHTDPEELEEGCLVVNPVCLQPHEAGVVAARLDELFREVRA